MLWLRRSLLGGLVLTVALLTWSAPTLRAQESAAPGLIFPFPPGQTWRVTCGYTLPEVSDPAACGHSGSQWNRYALDLQHVEGRDAAAGQPVFAAAAGTVGRAGWQDGLGWHVLLDHGDGYATVYAHFREPPAVQAGAQVSQGGLLGNVGCTGRCTGAHLHFALLKDGESVPPEPLCGHRDLRYWQQLSECAAPAGRPERRLAPGGADFDGDGSDDLAFLYDPPNGAAHVDVLTSTGAAFDSTGREGWWRAEGTYRFEDVVHASAGDFDGDGRTDLAVLLDEGGCAARVRVWLAASGRFAPLDPAGWWASPAFCARQVEHADSGDFDGDGLADLALTYEAGFSDVHVQVLRSDGGGFVAQSDGWWRSDGSWQGWPTHVLPGDFDADGRTDLVVLYRYAGCRSHVRVLLSTGQALQLSSESWWLSASFCAASVVDGASGDLDGDGVADDLAFLSRDASGDRIDVLRSDGARFLPDEAAWWQGAALSKGAFGPPSLLALLPGDFDKDGRSDLAALEESGACAARIRVFASRGDRFQPSDWWSSGSYCAERVRHAAP